MFDAVTHANAILERIGQLNAKESHKAEAVRMYRDSELDDEIRDRTDPADAFRIALAVLDFIDDEATDSASLERALAHLPLEIRDLRTAVLTTIRDVARRDA